MTSLPDVRQRTARRGAEPPGRDWLRFPVVWATGEFGTLLIPSDDWRGLAYAYQAAGAPYGEPSRHVWLYTWNGRYFEPHIRVEPHHPTIWGSLIWSAWWSWLPSMYAAVIFHAVTTAGTTPITDSQFLVAFIVSMCVCWAFVHWLRWLGRTQK